MNTKTWIIFGAICVALFGALIFISKKDQISTDVSSINPETIIKASEQNGNIADHVEGKADSKVVVVEYGDFQCPYCGQAYPGTKQVVSDYSDKISFVFRNFPLTSAHPNALSAATAAEAAGLQDKYWKMHDILYENQDAWSNLTSDQRTDKFVGYAKQIGADTTKFRSDLSQKSIATKISFDQAIGKKKGVTGTPSFYVDGEKISDDTYASLLKNDTASFRSFIDKKLKDKGIDPPAAKN